MQVHVHDHSLSSCLYFHFQSRCLAAVFRSSGIRKTGAASEARQEREETPRGVGSEHPGPVCHPAAAFRHHRCKTELSFPTTGSHTSGSQLCHGSCPLAAPSSLAGLIRKTQLKLFILLAMHKVEMQKEVKPVDCWLRSDPGNLGLPSTASQ